MVSGVCWAAVAGGKGDAQTPAVFHCRRLAKEMPAQGEPLYLEPERACRVSGDDRFFVGANHADGGACVVGRDHRITHAVSAFFEGDSQGTRGRHGFGEDLGRILTDAARKDQEVKAPQGGGQAADGCAGAVAEHRDGFGCAHVSGPACEEVAHVGTGFGNAEQARFVVDHAMEGFADIPAFCARYQDSSGSISPHRVLITRPDDGVRPIVVSIGRPPCTAAMLAPEPRWARMMRPAAVAAPPTRAISSMRNVYESP